MSNWIKLHTVMQHDPKITALGDELFRFWIGLLLMAGELGHGGSLGSTSDIAIYFHRTKPATDRLLAALEKIKVVAKRKEIWEVKNWKKWQAKPSDSKEAWAERKRKQREEMSRPTRHASEGGTQPMSRPVPRQKRREEKRLSTTTASAEEASKPPMTDFSNPEIVASLFRVCNLDPKKPADVEACRVVDEALGDHFPEVTAEQLLEIYGPHGWWHKNYYPELAVPMPPAPGQILTTLEEALLPTSALDAADQEPT
jgi:hypothetical protein